ncbi:MAG TPA: DUF5655 domain-containing protein [Puia sp.]|nr:DUF5655 domain-containing protein [Puia sp.]
MWTCPKCQQTFYHRNQSHSCGQFSVEGFLAGKTDQSKSLFEAFLEAYRAIGPFSLHPVKTRIALLTKIRFASVNKLGVNWLDGHLVMTELHDQPAIFYKIDNLGNRFFVHHFRLHSEDDISPTLLKYMALAYKVGNREHIKPGTTGQKRRDDKNKRKGNS